MTISADDKKQGWRQFTIGMTLYAMLIIGLNVLSGPLQLDKRLLIALTFVPILAALWAMLGWIKVVRGQDELQQKIVSEGVHWAVGLTALSTFSYGLLESYANLPRLSMMWVVPLIGVTGALGQAFAWRRYR